MEARRKSKENRERESQREGMAKVERGREGERAVGEREAERGGEGVGE